MKMKMKMKIATIKRKKCLRISSVQHLFATTEHTIEHPTIGDT